MSVLSDIAVSRDDDGAYEITWRQLATGEIRIYAGRRPDAIDTSAPVAVSDSGSARIASLAPTHRYFFRLDPGNGKPITVSERRFNLTGAPNVRDLGGYPTADGGRVRWGVLFRSGRLSGLSGSDKHYLRQLDIGMICDFRHPMETLSDPTDLGADYPVAVHNIPISPGSHGNFAKKFTSGDTSYRGMTKQMAAIYRELALRESEAYREMFKLLLETQERGFLIHCSAGKDRTGFGAGIILLALGVPREVILRDYLLTGRYYPPAGESEYVMNKYAGYFDKLNDSNPFQALMETRAEYLRAAFDAIDAEFSNAETYLEEMFGVDRRVRGELVSRYVAVGD